MDLKKGKMTTKMPFIVSTPPPDDFESISEDVDDEDFVNFETADEYQSKSFRKQFKGECDGIFYSIFRKPSRATA